MQPPRFASPLSRAFLVMSVALALLVLIPRESSAAPTRYEAENATISQGLVESNHAGFSGTGFVNYNNVTGSYVEWTVNAVSAGSASLRFRHANGSTTNRPMDITVNGVLVADELAFNPTSAWTTWQTVTTTAAVNAGSNTIRATATTANGGPNVDFLDFEVAVPAADYQAEDATISQGIVESNWPGFTGTGFVNYNNVVGSYVQWTVSVASAGTTALTFRFANGSTANRPMDITVNGTLVGNDVAFVPTGAWSTWQTATVNAALVAGTNTIRATAVTTSGGPNVDKLTLGAGGGNPGKVAWAGVRSSRYGISPFPSPSGWGNAMTTMASYFPGSTPVGLWLAGEIEFNGTQSGQHFNFPNPGGTWDSTILFNSTDQNEDYLDYFDTHGIKVWLQVEPGFSPMNQLIDIVWRRYGSHPSVVGFGVDVEWYRSSCDGCSNATVSDSTAQAWEQKVKSVNPNWTLFLKHYDASNLPTTYRGDIIFVDDSEQNGSYDNFKSEMINFANRFYPNPVMFQIGYPSDKPWWSGLATPIPKTIGDDLARLSRQDRVGVVWVDFSLRDVLPTS